MQRRHEVGEVSIEAAHIASLKNHKMDTAQAKALNLSEYAAKNSAGGIFTPACEAS